MLQSSRPGYSCLLCRQRKVRCDRRTPCSNCVKTEKECSFIPPVRGKRKRNKPPREGLHAKLKRYEEMLKSYGATIEPSEDFNDFDSETTSQPNIDMDENDEPQSKDQSDPYALVKSKPMLITKEGTSRYFESALWSNVGNEFQHPEAEGFDESIDGSNLDESGMFLEPGHYSRFENLASLHLSFQILPKLRDIYVDRVDPLMKILHLPTFWPALTEGLRRPQDLPKSLEAAIFAFYMTVISTLKEDECQNLFGIQPSVMISRYRLATRQALVNAGFLSTSNPMTLRAYAMFMMAVRNSYRCDTLFILSGVAIRLARKMGLHRDGTSLGLSPFETEMRRRLWWHLVHTDFRMADLLGTRPSLDIASGDTKLPLNVEDEDLHPDMIDPPPERSAVTNMSLCLLRCEIIETLRKVTLTCPSDVHWEVLYNPDITLAKKDSVINQIEDHLERKYLRYCDPSNTLHTFVSVVSRSCVCKMRLFAHHPRRFANSPAKAPQSERNIVFENAMKLLEYVTLIRGGYNGLNKYMWQVGASYLWRVMLYVLIEARHRKTGPEVDKSWQLIGVAFSQDPQASEGSPGPVHRALGKWTLEVWDDYVAALKAEDLPEPSTPEYINTIRRHRRVPIESSSKTNDLATDPGPSTRNPFGHNKIYSQGQEENLTDFEPFESYDFPTLLSFETDPNEWIQWEQLVADESGVAQIDTMY